MWFLCERSLVDLLRNGSVSLRSTGIEPCMIDGSCPDPPPQHRERQARLTKGDIEWLKACGIAWEHRPAAQLSLDFCGRQEACTFEEVQMKKECTNCHGTGKCPLCKGTGRFGYPGIGPVDMYPTICSTCQGSGDCRVCRGAGQK